MKSKLLHMESTKIDPGRTALDIQAELVKAGATQVATSFRDGKAIGMHWSINVNGVETVYQMPARVEPIHRIFCRRKGYKQNRTPDGRLHFPHLMEQAERVAWRQLLRWVQAQIAMIETGMVQPQEAFAAYWIPPGQTQTLFALIEAQQFKALPAPGAQ